MQKKQAQEPGVWRVLWVLHMEKKMTKSVDLTYYKLITSQLSYGTQILYNGIPIHVVMYDCRQSWNLIVFTYIDVIIYEITH